MAASVGLSVAVNTIEDSALAFIGEVLPGVPSDTHVEVTAQQNVSVQAISGAKIDALTIAGAGSGSFGGGSGLKISLAGAGAGSGNSITDTISANIAAASIVTTTLGGVSVNASDARALFNTTTNVSSIVTGLNTGSVSSDLNTAFAGNGVSLSSDLTVEKISDVQWRVRDNSARLSYIVTKTSATELDISLATTIIADSIAGAFALAVGGSGTSVAVAIGATVAVNDIENDITANVTGSTIHSNGDVDITAISAATIEALTVGVAVSASGGKTSVSVSIGLSISQDMIDNDVLAYIDSGDIETTVGGIEVSATGVAAIEATSAAASLAIAVGSKLAVAVAGAGAESTNTILGKTDAYILSSDIDDAGKLTIAATQQSNIDALVLALSGGAAAIGVAVALNYIGVDPGGAQASDEILAYSKDSTLSVGGDLTISALSTETIKAGVGAGTVGLAIATGTAISFAGSGVFTQNEIAIDLKAYVDGDGTGADAGVSAHNISVTATDASAITAEAGAAAVALSFAGENAVSISIGLALAHNRIDNDVAAYIVNVGSLSTGGVGNGLTVAVVEQSSITATAVAVAVSVAIGGSGAGVAVAGGGAESTNVILTHANAYIQDSAIGTSAAKVGNVTISATSTSAIQATIAAVAASVTFGGEVGVGVALGIGVARNFIGWDPTGTNVITTIGSHDKVDTLATGDKVKIASGPMAGEVFEYIGPTLTDGDPNVAGIQKIDLSTQSYQDASLWKPVSIKEFAAEIQAQSLNSSIQSGGALSLTANANETIDAIVIAGAVALAGGGDTGVGVAGAGVYTENKIKTLVTAGIIGDGADPLTGGITATSVTLGAHDSSVINAVAGAASLAGSVGGDAGVSVAIGLSLAFNDISNVVSASITNADQGVFTNGGAVQISASSDGSHLFDLNMATMGLTAAQLDGAAKADQDDPGTAAVNEASADAASDYTILETLRDAFPPDQALAIDNSVATAATYTTDYATPVDLREGTTVKLAAGYANGGTAGRVYRYIGANADAVTLGAEDYTTSDWLLVEPLKISVLDAGKRWSLVAPDGRTFILELELELNGDTLLSVGRDTINAVSAAAALAAGFGGDAGVAISGAGAVAQNVVLTKVDAYADNSKIGSAANKVGDVTLDARSGSTINSTVVAASLAIGGGGDAGVGVSIGIAVAQNFIGWEPGASTSTPAEVEAYLKDTSLQSGGALSLTSTAAETINSIVIAGSVAVGVGGAAGIAASGSGVWAENKIGVDVKSYINGDGTAGILADSVTLSSSDTSTINALGGAASLAASLGGSLGLSISIAVSLARNTITSDVSSYILNADGASADPADFGVTATTTDGITVTATESATINAITFAASAAAGFGIDAGIAVSGAGADANNIILTGTHAYVQGSALSSAGKVDVEAADTAVINATVISASFGVAAGIAGVGASIGVAMARNYIGFDPDYLRLVDLYHRQRPRPRSRPTRP